MGDSQDFLNKIDYLIQQGKRSDALREIDQISDPSDELLLRKVYLLDYRGKFREGLKLSQAIAERTDNLETRLKALVDVAGTYWRLGQFTSSLEIMDRIEPEFDQIEPTKDLMRYKSFMKTTKGNIFAQQGKLDQAIEQYSIGMEIASSIDDRDRLWGNANNIGEVYHKKFNLPLSKEYYEKALNYALNEEQQILPKTNLSLLLLDKGQIFEADELLDEVILLSRKYGDKYSLTVAYRIQGDIHQSINDLEEAEKYYKLSLQEAKRIGNKIEMIYALSSMIQLSLKTKVQNLREYKDSLELINTEVDSEVARHHKLYADAVSHLSKQQFRERIRAIDLLKEIINDKVADIQITVRAIISYVEISLEELKLTSDEKIIDELVELINNLITLAKDNHSLPLVIESYLLQAQLSLIRGSIELAQNYMDQAKISSEELGLEHLYHKIISIEDEFYNELKTWKQLIDDHSSLKDRLSQSQIADYIERIQKMRMK